MPSIVALLIFFDSIFVIFLQIYKLFQSIFYFSENNKKLIISKKTIIFPFLPYYCVSEKKRI